ncbi:Sec-independent protein translocase protein TatB [Pelagibius marinus]|uniref:Sec-independent protein translocase protein TatB n=1 Tax=Pelagibius marinus TaxID=2762760 RepID=UPI001873298B|nr:Sec-independent protein translocase protein TatB [Pelagibius marinus]
MFDIGWSEMAVIALIALVVIGPKDLPKTMKTIAHWMRKARSLTREFQSGIDEMVREAELEDAKKALEATRGGNLQRTLSNALDPDDEVGGEVRAIEKEARSESSASSSEDGESNAEKAAAKMPSANVAPAHSLTPAAEDTPQAGTAEGGGEPVPAAGDEGSKKTA